MNVKEFKIRNQTKTSNERQAAADQVPPSMVNDPAPIKDLADRLDDLTVTIAKTERFEDFRETVEAAWKLKPETYLDIKAATDTPERRDKLHVQIHKAFEPLLRRRRARPRGPAPQRRVQPRSCRSTTRASRWTDRTPGPRERVVPERIAKPDGPVYQDFVAAFTTPRIGEILFRLIAEQIDADRR